MPFNIYTFVLSEKFASDEFAKRGVTDNDSVRQTALITGFLSPANGGINGAVIPALFAKEKASRDADAAVASRPILQPAPPTTPPEPGTPQPGTPQPGTPPDQQPSVETRIAAIESAFAPYTDFVDKTVGTAKPELEKNFIVAVKDDTGQFIFDAPPETPIIAQQPDPKGTTTLLKGLPVSLIIKKK
jgi:hypothetical protein